MQPGKLRHKITIKTPTATQADDGQAIKSYATFLTCWADVQEQDGSETVQKGKEVAVVNQKVWIRYAAGVTSDMRIIFGSRTLEILAALPDRSYGRSILLKTREVL